jgi:chemotaxis protein methyltransferase CheR
MSTNQALKIADLPPASADREFDFSDADFRELSEIAYRQTGIVLSEAKRNLVYGRVSRRLRRLDLTSFVEYRKYLAEHNEELELFINAISTNLTKFFRESHHFDHFQMQIAEPYGRDGARRLRIWSAGCSTGEEPYTIAMVLAQAMRPNHKYDAKILATDIDTEVVARGAAGEYSKEDLQNLPPAYRDAFDFEAGKSGGGVMPDTLRRMISFGRLNLIEPWPMKGPFDAIFCRNVMIYFDGPTKMSLVNRFVEILRPGGFLYIGHSESLLTPVPGLRLMGRTIYRREA